MRLKSNRFDCCQINSTNSIFELAQRSRPFDKGQKSKWQTQAIIHSFIAKQIEYGKKLLVFRVLLHFSFDCEFRSIKNLTNNHILSLLHENYFSIWTTKTHQPNTLAHCRTLQGMIGKWIFVSWFIMHAMYNVRKMIIFNLPFVVNAKLHSNWMTMSTATECCRWTTSFSLLPLLCTCQTSNQSLCKTPFIIVFVAMPFFVCARFFIISSLIFMQFQIRIFNQSNWKVR